MENVNRTLKNRLTRMRIGESILAMLERTPLSEIRVSNIAAAAGISRMTFYHYYETKEKALVDYLVEILALYIAEAKKRGIAARLYTQERLEFTFQFFARYEHSLLQLDRIGCSHLLFEGLDQFLETYGKRMFDGSAYNLHMYSGALLHVFMRWLRNGRKESAGEIARIVLSGLPNMSV